MRISDWSSDVCSSDLGIDVEHLKDLDRLVPSKQSVVFVPDAEAIEIGAQRILVRGGIWDGVNCIHALARDSPIYGDLLRFVRMIGFRSDENTSELQSLMRISNDDFCL